MRTTEENRTEYHRLLLLSQRQLDREIARARLQGRIYGAICLACLAAGALGLVRLLLS